MRHSLTVSDGRRLDLWLLLWRLLLRDLLLGAIIIVCRRHGSGGGISGVRVHRRSEIRMGECFGGGDAFGRIKLQETFQ